MAEQASSPTSPRDWWVTAGLTVTAISALASSFTGLRSLAVLAGWAPVMAPLLPLTVDAYAMTATRVWLAESTTSARARRFARSNAIGAIMLSLIGNGTDHLLVAGLLHVSWVVVVAVGSVPPAVLGLVSHQAVLRTQTDAPVPTISSRSTPTSHPVRRPPEPPTGTPAGSSIRRVPKAPDNPPRSQDELLAAARVLDTDWQALHNGQPITRDELRRSLRISAERAGAVLRRLKADPDETASAPLIPQVRPFNSSEEATNA